MVKKKLIFDEETHTYKLGNKKLKSVTEWIKNFFGEFDEEAISYKMSLKRVSKADFVGDDEGYFQALRDAKKEILAEWQETRELGTKVHKEVEDWFNSRTQPTSPKAIAAVNWALLSNEWHKYPHKFSEAKIYSEKYGLAGTIDLLILRGDDLTKQRAAIVDWKTNETIREQNPYQSTSSTSPVAYLHDSSLVKYMLQLSTYALILEEEYDTLIDRLMIVKLEDKRYVEIPIDYLKETVKKMLLEDAR